MPKNLDIYFSDNYIYVLPFLRRVYSKEESILIVKGGFKNSLTNSDFEVTKKNIIKLKKDFDESVYAYLLEAPGKHSFQEQVKKQDRFKAKYIIFLRGGEVSFLETDLEQAIIGMNNLITQLLEYKNASSGKKLNVGVKDVLTLDGISLEGLIKKNSSDLVNNSKLDFTFYTFPRDLRK